MVENQLYAGVVNTLLINAKLINSFIHEVEKCRKVLPEVYINRVSSSEN